MLCRRRYRGRSRCHSGQFRAGIFRGRVRRTQRENLAEEVPECGPMGTFFGRVSQIGEAGFDVVITLHAA